MLSIEDNLDNTGLPGLNESIVFGGASLKNDLFDFDFAPDSEDLQVDTLSSNSLKTISVINGKIAESATDFTSFEELTEEVFRFIIPSLSVYLICLKFRPLDLSLLNYSLNCFP